MNRNIEGKMWFDTLFIDFDRFPVLNVKTTNGYLISHVPYFSGDTLCRFDSLKLDIDIVKIISKPTTIDIPEVHLDNAYACVRLDTASVSSWALWRFIKSEPKPKHKAKKSASAVVLNIAKIYLKNKSDFVYHNDHSGLTISASSDSLLLDGRIAIDYKKIWANFLTFKNLDFYLNNPKSGLLIDLNSHDFYLDNLSPPAYANIAINLHNIQVKGYALPKPAQFFIDGHIKIDDFKTYWFNDFKLGFNENYIKFEGNFDARKRDSLLSADFNLEVQLHSPNVQSLMDYLPPSVAYPESGLDLDFPITSDIILKGILSPVKNKYPHISLSSIIPSGVIQVNKVPISSKIYFNTDLSLSIKNYKDVDFNIEKLNISAFDTRLDYKGLLSLYKKNIDFDGYLGLNGNLKDIKAIFPDTVFNYQADYNASFYINANKKNKFKINELCGGIDFTSLAVTMNKEDSIYVDRLGVSLSPKIRTLNYNETENKFIASDSVLVKLITDSVSGYYQGLNFDIDKFNVSARIDNRDVFTPYIPARGNLDISELHLEYNSEDSLLIGDLTSVFGVNSLTKEFELTTVIKNIFAKSTYVNMVSSELGTVVRGEYKDTTKIPDIYGALLSDKIYLYSPVLPLNNEVRNMQILFSPEYLKIKKLDMTSGASSLNICGQFDNWSNFLFNKDKLVGNLDVVSDSLDINQLIEAITRGVLYLDKREQPDIDSLMERIFPPYFLPPMEEQQHSKKKELIYIPSNLNFKINLDAENIVYDNQKMQQASGTILVAENRLIINDMTFLSKDIGSLFIDAEYFTPDSLNAEASVSLMLNNLNVENLVSLTPDLVTLVPILSSVKGNVNCEMSAMAMLDSTMYVKLGTLDALARVEGSKLSIEKKRVLPKFLGWLLLGDRKLISLDSVSVDVEIKDSIISVYPFLASVGPYKFSASGVQNLDRSFFYHISILKWPLWFKFGFNIYGSDDDIHFRLASPKLTNLNLPARILSTSVTNLYPSYSVKKDFRKSVVEKQDAFDKLNEYYKSIIAMPDSLPYSKDEDLFDQLNKLKSNSNSGR